MNYLKVGILLSALLVSILGLTAHLNTCPAFETQVVSFIQTTIGSNFTSPITCNVTLITAQPASNYFPAVGYRSLSMPNTGTTIQIILYTSTITTTNFIVNLKGPFSGSSMQILDFNYLIIPGGFNNDIYGFTLQNFVSSGSGVFDYTVSSGSIAVDAKDYSGTINPGNYSFVSFINELNIEVIYNQSKRIGLSLDVIMLNVTFYLIRFTSCSEETIRIEGYRVTIIAFKIPSSSYGVKITTFVLGFPHSINDTSISPTKTFFGLKGYCFQNADLQFTIQIVNQTVSQNFSMSMMGFNSQIISFEVGKCCLSTPFLDITNSNCTSSCPDRSYSGYYSDNITMACYPCRYDCKTCQNDSACNTCDSTDFRQLNLLTFQCNPIKGYYDSGAVIALPCNYPHCCGDTPVGYNTSCVVACPSGFVANSTNICVPCSVGYWAVSGHCTNVVGCVAARSINGSVQCIFCKVAEHFILENQTCICSQGYSLDMTTGKCFEKCGDGIHFSQKCDDNNTEDGDGCSSTCQPEDYFKCNSTSNYIASQCAYIGTVSLSFNYVNKTEGKNQAVFSFGFSAKRAKLNAAKIVNSFVFACDPHIATVTMSASSTEVFLFVDYDEDLQGKLANVTFYLDSKKVLSSSTLSTSILMTASKTKLVFLHTLPIIINLWKTVQVLALIALVVFLLASLIYRMLAVELLHYFLLLYILCLQTDNPTQAFLVFKNLRVLALNFEAAGNYYSQGSVFPYSFENELKTKQILSLLLIVTLAATLILKIVRLCLKDSAGKLAMKHVKVLKVFKQRIRQFLFCLSIGYGYEALIPSFIFSASKINYQTYQYQAISMVLFITVCFGLLFFKQFGAVLWDKIDVRTSRLLQARNYNSIYLFIWIFTMTLQAANTINKIERLQQLFLVLYLFFFSWFICVMPYSSSLHNVGQIINIFTIVLFLIWSVGRKYSSALTDEYNEAYISIVIIAFMSMSIVLSIVRTIQVIVSDCQPTTKQNPTIVKSKDKEQQQIEEQCKQIEGSLTIKNKYQLRSMQLNQQLLNINNILQSNKYSHRKRQLLLRLKQKYNIKSNESENNNHFRHIQSKAGQS